MSKRITVLCGVLAAALVGSQAFHLAASSAAGTNPTATDDEISVVGGQQGSVNVLSNDTASSGSLTVSDWSDAAKGDAECEAGGTCTYYVASSSTAYDDTFEYEVADSQGTDIGKVTVHVRPGGGGPSPSTSPSTSPTTHSRTIGLGLTGHLTAKGKVTAGDGFSACEAGVSVKIERRNGRRWQTLKTVDTDDAGSYSTTVPNKSGSYRAQAPRTTMGSDVCGAATSKVHSR